MFIKSCITFTVWASVTCHAVTGRLNFILLTESVSLSVKLSWEEIGVGGGGKVCRVSSKPYIYIFIYILYENVDQILLNKLHGPMHYKIGVTYVYKMDTCYILCYNNMTVSSTYFRIQQSE